MAYVIPTRKLGNSGVSVGEIGLGCMTMSSVPFLTKTTNPDVDRTPWFQAKLKALEMGCNFFNTGEFYGDNELVLKEFFSKYPGTREKVFISVKAGIDLSKSGPNGDPDFIKSNIDFNLERLGVDKIDLYQSARADPKTPIEITVGAIAEYIKAGKVGHIGLSEVNAETIRRAHAVHPIACVEVEYSLSNLDPEQNGVLKACEELGIALVAYSPLGRGLLTGHPIKTTYGHFPRFQGENLQKNLELADAIIKIAQKHKVTPSQLCLAWVLHQSPVIIPIPGTTKTERVIENLEASKIKLSEEDLKEIRDVLARHEIVGARYPAHSMTFCHGGTIPLSEYKKE